METDAREPWQPGGALREDLIGCSIFWWSKFFRWFLATTKRAFTAIKPNAIQLSAQKALRIHDGVTYKQMAFCKVIIFQGLHLSSLFFLTVVFVCLFVLISLTNGMQGVSSYTRH